jgi:sulfatase maturation enzyme AslB (radical SAM superfamily)
LATEARRGAGAWKRQDRTLAIGGMAGVERGRIEIEDLPWRSCRNMSLETTTSVHATGDASTFPAQPLLHLDALWIQVAGSLCNLECVQCFVSAGPGNHHHALMSRDQVRRHVGDALALGVKEFFFTGGEPFVHPEMIEILEDTLGHGPSTVLTNGTLWTRGRLAALASLAQTSRYSLEIRVSLDGGTAEEHDRYRGAGTFERTVLGLIELESHGLLPIVTVTQHGDEDPLAFRARYFEMLKEAGLKRPRIKIIPLFLLGRETARTRAYDGSETLRGLPPENFDPLRLQCGGCRAVTSRGVFVCPLLVDEAGARMGTRLDETLGPFELRYGACHTCWVTGMTCANG